MTTKTMMMRMTKMMMRVRMMMSMMLMKLMMMMMIATAGVCNSISSESEDFSGEHSWHCECDGDYSESFPDEKDQALRLSLTC